MEQDNGRVASPPGSRPSGQAASRLDASRIDPSRIATAIQGYEEVATYFDTDPVEAASHMAWHAGYEAGARADAAFSAGYAQAERDIIDWMRAKVAGFQAAAEAQGRKPGILVKVYTIAADAIEAAGHRDSDRNPQGEDAQRLRAEHESAGRSEAEASQ